MACPRKARQRKRTQTSQDLPDAVQVAEVQLLPETAAKTVTNPAGDGQHPQSHRQLGQTQNLLVCAAEKEIDLVIIANQNCTEYSSQEHRCYLTISSRQPGCKAGGGQSNSKRRHWLLV